MACYLFSSNLGGIRVLCVKSQGMRLGTSFLILYPTFSFFLDLGSFLRIIMFFQDNFLQDLGTSVAHRLHHVEVPILAQVAAAKISLTLSHYYNCYYYYSYFSSSAFHPISLDS